ncbi:MAG: DUF3368 domain-containing protein [Candidatus Binatus sp.]|nr:DUF3368 domain-containing protein [Candidatus Binatus sp.]
MILIEGVHVLPEIFDEVLVPRAVARELKHPGAPLVVRQWIAKPPRWLRVAAVSNLDPALGYLGSGEQEAIALALTQHADALLMDEKVGRREAQRRNLAVIGTLAVLDEADRAGHLDFGDALGRLRQTNFRLSPALLRILARRRSEGQRR